MNTFHKITAAIILALSVALTSCQQENTITPDVPASAAVQAEDASAKTNNLAPFEKYRLIAHGLNPLTYVNGKLASVDFAYGATKEHIVRYEYKNIRSNVENEIKATVYQNGYLNKISDVITYKIDVSTGRCFESTHQAFDVGNILVPDLKPKTWRYIYNAAGQLEKRFNKNNLLEWFDYQYLNGDMKKAFSYDEKGKKVKEVWFGYAQPSGQQLKKNLYPLYIEEADLPDRFLKVFGKSSEHLLTTVSKKYIALVPLSVPYEHIYTYTYNTDGYVTGESKFRLGLPGLFEYKRFDYETQQ